MQLSAAPDAEAADGPDPPEPVPPVVVPWPRVSAAPGPVEATDIVCGLQAPPPAVQEALPVEVWGAPVVGSGLAAELVAWPAQPVAPAGQLTDPEATDTAEGPLAAAGCPGRVTVGAEEAWVVVCAWQPPWLTWQLPEPSALLALPPSTEASEPLPVECTVPEQLLDPAGQLVEADPLDVLTNSSVPTCPSTCPVLTVAPDAVAPPPVWGTVRMPTELFAAPWQDPAVVVHDPLPVEVLVVAGLPRLATPVVGSTVLV